MFAPIAILTDFGTADPFVGIMKGVIAGIAPAVPILDLTHEIPPGDIRRAAVTLWMSVPYFPAGTVFLVVVDPGVGTNRRAVIVQSADPPCILIGPDNGVFSLVTQSGYQAWELTNPELALPDPGYTFHGRDRFSPAAAHLVRGAAPPSFGPSLQGDLYRLPPPHLAAPQAGILEGEILYPDRFGNLLTSLGRFETHPAGGSVFRPWLRTHLAAPPAARISLETSRLVLPGGRALAGVRTFAEVPKGKIAFLPGSSGLLEIVSNNQSAAAQLHLEAEARVRLEWKEFI